MQNEMNLPTLSTKPNTKPGDRLVLRILILVGVVLAGYVGFRLPNLWATTLYNISVQDGGFRRSLLGTVLAPLWSFFDYSYWAFACVAFVILAGLLIVIVVASWKAKNNGQRIVALVWLFAPTGAYLFHEVGYLDQLLYLLLFLSVWMWSKSNPYIAIIPVALSVFVHESAMVTTVPLLLFFAIAKGGFSKKLLAFALPLAAAALVALEGPWSAGQSVSTVDRLSTSLPFAFREDALFLFNMGIRETWVYVNWVPGLNLAAPFIVTIFLFWLLQALRCRSTTQKPFLLPSLALLASISPFLLIAGGYDIYRWVFLTLGNFAIVLYWWLGNRARAFDLADLALGLLPFVVLYYAPLIFFDDLMPRSLLFWTVDDLGFWTFPTI
jgi:hypothetical protein